MASASHEETEGRAAPRPSRFSWSDWKAILLRVKGEIGADNLSLVAAGVAFYAMLAIFPAIAALIGLYGFFADPAQVAQHMEMAASFMPPEAAGILTDQIEGLTADGGETAGFAAIFATLLAIWSSRSGVNALVTGLNIVYDEEDARGFFAQVLTTLGLTALLLVVGIVAIASIVVLPIILDLFNLGAAAEWIVAIGRWPIVLAAILFALAALYRFGPHRESARVEWISWGAAIATLLWLIGSAAFSLYVANFANYNETYGSIGAVIGLLMWFYLSAYIVLLGAELNAEMEHHICADTTTGAAEPRGERGAHVADHVA